MEKEEYTIKVTEGAFNKFWWTIYHNDSNDAESVFHQDSFIEAFEDAILLLKKRQERGRLMARHGEYAMLIAATNAALVRSMDDGDIAHYNGRWLEGSVDDRLRHAYIHLCALLNNEGDAREHIDHAICDLAMFKVRYDEGN